MNLTREMRADEAMVLEAMGQTAEALPLANYALRGSHGRNGTTGGALHDNTQDHWVSIIGAFIKNLSRHWVVHITSCFNKNIQVTAALRE